MQVLLELELPIKLKDSQQELELPLSAKHRETQTIKDQKLLPVHALLQKIQAKRDWEPLRADACRKRPESTRSASGSAHKTNFLPPTKSNE